MKNVVYILSSVLFIAMLSCAKQDKNLPYISTVKINNLGTDTVYLVQGTFEVDYQVSDDELVVDSRIRITENANPDSGFFYLNIQRINSNNYNGFDLIVVPDSVKEDSKLYLLTVDAYDNSGNEALQWEKTIYFK